MLTVIDARPFNINTSNYRLKVVENYFYDRKIATSGQFLGFISRSFTISHVSETDVKRREKKS